MGAGHDMTRRRFLQASLGVTGALAFTAPQLSAEGSPRQLRLGFLGTAYSHFNEKLKVVRESTDLELVGLCEEDEAVRAKGPKDARWLTRQQLFAEAEIVVVESAVKDHARHAGLALRAAKHVHVEKPPADTLAGLRELFALATSQRRRLQIGYMWRHNPGINAALEAARRGWLGEIYLVRATMNTLAGPEQRREWARFRGGAMFEQGCHLIDPVVRLLGAPTKVTPFLRHHGAAADTLADNTVAVLEFPKALAIVTSAPLQPDAGPQRFFEVLGTNGTARVQPLEPPALTLVLAQAAGPYAAGRQDVKLPPYHRYVDEFAELVKAIREDQPLPIPVEEDLRVQETLLRACGML